MGKKSDILTKESSNKVTTAGSPMHFSARMEDHASTALEIKQGAEPAHMNR